MELTPNVGLKLTSCLALERFRASEQAKDVQFTIKYYPYLLYPDFGQEGEDKYEW
jgi:hypothetical protein